MFPVMFAIPRTSGWLAQWEEMLADKEQKIARPRQIYTGDRTGDYVADRRSRLGTVVATTDAVQRFRALADSSAPVPVDEAHALYDGLEPVACEDMLGDWDGGVVPTGHPGEQQLGALGWAGKSFRGPNDVDPIVCRGEDGARQANPVLGAASLRAVEHRGIVTATMVYDKHPVFDHFRRVDEVTVLGSDGPQGRRAASSGGDARRPERRVPVAAGPTTLTSASLGDCLAHTFAWIGVPLSMCSRNFLAIASALFATVDGISSDRSNPPTRHSCLASRTSRESCYPRFFSSGSRYPPPSCGI